MELAVKNKPKLFPLFAFDRLVPWPNASYVCFLRLLQVIVFISIAFSSEANARNQQDSISNISFSPDGTKLMFDRCPQGKCAIHVYDLKTGDFGYYQAPDGEFWGMGRFSHDGNWIAFSRTPRDAKGERILEDMQIAVMKLDGSEVGIITHGEGAKIYPSFSHSGDKILYDWAKTTTKTSKYVSESLKRKMPASDYDLFEVDVQRHRQTQLTDYAFGFATSRPFYRLNDVQFIFSGEYPKRYSTSMPKLEGAAILKGIKAYEQKYGRNQLYVLSPGDTELVPYLAARNGTAYHPVLDAKGNLYFRDDKSMLYRLDDDRHVVAQWSLYPDEWKNKNTETYSFSYDISPDGKRVVCVWGKVEGDARIPKVGIRNLEDNSFHWVDLPAQAHKINK